MRSGILFLAMLIASGLRAQVSMSSMTRHDLAAIEQVWRKEGEAAFGRLSGSYPVYRMQGKYVLSVIARTGNGFDQAAIEQQGIIVGSKIGNIVTLKLPLNQIDALASLPGVTAAEIAARIQPHLNRAIKDVRADSVHMGVGLPQSYTGKNVYIGITDWGFDYTHPMFYDTALTQTRIAAAWDQFRQSGPHPQGFGYGTEYDTPSELLTAGSDTANIYSYGYHGSHVAGIAGGGGAGTEFHGAAFEAEFLFATFLIDAGAVLDAYQWMHQKATAAGKRLVINQSWGLYYMGNLDGTSMLSQAIDSYSDLGLVFVSSGGNNGDVNFHIKRTFSGDVLKSKVDFYSYSANPNMWGQSITAWGEPGKAFSVGMEVTNVNNLLLNQTVYYNTATTTDYIDTFLVVNASDTIFYNLSMEQANPDNQRPHARFRIKNRNTALRVVLKATADDGTVHFWNVTELSNGVGNWGMPFSVAGSGTFLGDPNYSIGEPSCTESVISVAAHSAQYALSNGNLAGGAIATFSSFGPTLDERQKPDISAPGVSVCSAVSSFTDNSFSTAATISFNGQSYKFTRISGTSMSSPMVSGAVALILEANPYLMPWQIKEIIRETARTDSYTGVVPAEGSMRWGMGKLNVYEAIKLALNTVSVDELDNGFSLRVYPNPTSGTLSVQGDHQAESYTVYAADGRVLQKGRVQSGKIDLAALPAGIYLLGLHFDGGMQRTVQVIRE